MKHIWFILCFLRQSILLVTLLHCHCLLFFNFIKVHNVLLVLKSRKSLIFCSFTGLVVPDVPLEETEILRKEATKYKIELVCFLWISSWYFISFLTKYVVLHDEVVLYLANLIFSSNKTQVLLTTPTTPSSRMKAIVEASEGFVYLVRPFILLNRLSFSSCIVIWDTLSCLLTG